MQIAASERPSALSVGCSQPVFGRREHFHVLCLFNGLQAGKFPLPSFEGAPRADGGAAGACKSCGERRASAPSFGCSQPVLGRRENFHVLRLFNALRAGKIRVPFSEPRPAMPRAAVAVRRLSAEADADRVASKRKGTNRILRPNLDEEYDNTDCVLRNDKTHYFRKIQLNHRHRLTAFSPASEEIIYAIHGAKYHAFRFVMRAAGLDPGIDPRTPKAPPGCLARGEAAHDEGRP